MLAHAGGVPETVLTLVAVAAAGTLLFATKLRRRREARDAPTTTPTRERDKNRPVRRRTLSVMPLLTAGTPAPDIEARQQDDSPLRLSDLRGRHVLVYFYPKDDTRGCTAEACSLNDSLDDFTSAGADVIGVSTDDWESHTRFRTKYGLRFALASDSDRQIATAYGVGRSAGVLPMLKRVSFLVGPDGTVAEVWPSVDPRSHAAQVLAAVQSQSGPATTAG